MDVQILLHQTIIQVQQMMMVVVKEKIQQHKHLLHQQQMMVTTQLEETISHLIVTKNQEIMTVQVVEITHHLKHQRILLQETNNKIITKEIQTNLFLYFIIIFIRIFHYF